LDVVTVGRSDNGGKVAIARLSPPGTDAHGAQDLARRHLHDLVDLYDRGMREPLPLYCKTSAAYAAAMASGKDGVAAARSKWESGKFPGEARDVEHERVLGARVPFEAVWAERPRADESGDGCDLSEETRFARYAHRLWDGLLAIERIDRR
jgi:exodeoxyribonuclease V gamma subunit